MPYQIQTRTCREVLIARQVYLSQKIIRVPNLLIVINVQHIPQMGKSFNRIHNEIERNN